MATRGITRRFFFLSGAADARAHPAAGRPNGRFLFPRVFSSSLLAGSSDGGPLRVRFILHPFSRRRPDALWNRNVQFSFFTSDTRDCSLFFSSLSLYVYVILLYGVYNIYTHGRIFDFYYSQRPALTVFYSVQHGRRTSRIFYNGFSPMDIHSGRP